ncbi:MAG TPA: hypothetical protein VFU02_23730, partial [Polyangiaceae bacterium]|nr:hypothetical protein [Polyangiaceae bacterium]
MTSRVLVATVVWQMVWDLGRGKLVVSVGALLLAYACGSSENSNTGDGSGGSGGSDNAASTSATSGGSSATSTTDGGRAGAGGETGEGGGGGAAGGDGGASCEDAEPPVPACEYPESPGGGSEGAACGVTPGSWFGLGESSPTTWPERDVSDWSSGSGVPTIAAKWGGHQIAFDPESLPVVSWQE